MAKCNRPWRLLLIGRFEVIMHGRFWVLTEDVNTDQRSQLITVEVELRRSAGRPQWPNRHRFYDLTNQFREKRGEELLDEFVLPGLRNDYMYSFKRSAEGLHDRKNGNRVFYFVVDDLLTLDLSSRRVN